MKRVPHSGTTRHLGALIAGLLLLAAPALGEGQKPGSEDDVSAARAREIARMLLPQNLYSQAYWTVSLQGVMHFLDQRLKPEAQYEIRRFAQAIHGLVSRDLERLGIEIEGLSG